MVNLSAYLLQHEYCAIQAALTPTQHFIVPIKINHAQESIFIIDCGASHSCLDKAAAEKIGLPLTISLDKAAGLGGIEMEKSETLLEQLCIGHCYFNNLSFAVLDLAHVNEALQVVGQSAIDGILGNDILLKSDAILDFKQAILFIKQP